MSRVICIKKHLEKHGEISRETALKEFHIDANGLGYVIHRLRKFHNMEIGLNYDKRERGFYRKYVLNESGKS